MGIGIPVIADTGYPQHIYARLNQAFCHLSGQPVAIGEGDAFNVFAFNVFDIFWHVPGQRGLTGAMQRYRIQTVLQGVIDNPSKNIER